MTDHSEEQFIELLSQLIPRVNKSLQATNKTDGIGLFFNPDNTVSVLLSIIEDDVSEAMTALQEGMIQHIKECDVMPVASCMAYPDYSNGKIIACLENNEHYAATALFPVKTTPHLHIDATEYDIEDGTIYLFGT